MAENKKRHLFAANWKMYKTIKQAVTYLHELTALIAQKQANDIYIAAPFTAINTLALEEQKLKSSIKIGAQNMSDLLEGALTGEISASMLIEAGAQFVILGHSERRRIFHEDNAFINKKVNLAFQAGLQPLLCIGETAEERKTGMTESVLETQLAEGLSGIKKEFGKNLIIAYEPVWAIGNGHAATPSDAEKSQLFIRKWLEKNWGSETAANIRILYGGSINSGNAKEFLKEKNIDGLLVGGASLTPKSFSDIINLN